MAVRIEQELPESARTAAAELYWEAFGRLLRPALGRSEHGIAVLTDGLEPSRAIAALDGDELVGLVGLHYGGRAFTQLGARSLLRHQGIARRAAARAAAAARRPPAVGRAAHRRHRGARRPPRRRHRIAAAARGGRPRPQPSASR